MQWYYAVNNQRQGPVAQADFDRLVADGVIRGDTLVWQQGMGDWLPYASVAATLPPPPGAGDDTAVCAVSGKRYPKREMIQYEGKWISAEHRDAYFQRMREGVADPSDSVVPGPFGYGGFWRRFVAQFIDGIILQVVNVFTTLLISMVFGAAGAFRASEPTSMVGIAALCANIAVAIGYQMLFIRKFDATPGKLAMGVKILRSDGSKLSLGRIIGRYFAQIISALPIAIGYIVAAFDDEKRAFHDRICDTRVIKTR